MKTVCSPEKCAACMACQDICPKNAVTVQVEIDRCIPYIREDLCVECGLCRKVCQTHHPLKPNLPQVYLQGWASDSQVRASGSSGGIAGALTQAFLAQGGCVCSCIYTEGEFRFRIAQDVKDAGIFAGSKYVKSDPTGAWKQVHALLASGRKVLIIALPCQVAAAKLYMGPLAEKLYTADLICHGSPSPKVLSAFWDQLGLRITNPGFRKKQSFRLSEADTPIFPEGVRDRYTLAFLNGLVYTENCYDCAYAREERVSDLTLGDAWGAQVDPQEEALGVSLILCQSQKGRELLEMAQLILTPADRETALANNQQLCHPYAMPQSRQKVIAGLEAGQPLSTLVRQAVPKQSRNQDIKSMLTKIGLFRKD